MTKMKTQTLRCPDCKSTKFAVRKDERVCKKCGAVLVERMVDDDVEPIFIAYRAKKLPAAMQRIKDAIFNFNTHKLGKDRWIAFKHGSKDGSCHTEGYGKTEDEAIADLKKNVHKGIGGCMARQIGTCAGDLR